MSTTNATGITSPVSPADGGVEGGQSSPTTETNYPYGFGYAYQGLLWALSLLRSHQYDRAIESLSRDVAFMERMRGGWNPEAER